MDILFIYSIALFALFTSLLCFFIYTVYHAINNTKLYSTQRLLWILIILLATIFGWIAYWTFGRNGSNRSK
ncbi:PLDc N-terminal domain-containing protein [Sphingobacterium luzhongxinii]|uniref:PLDc N-terminal domain-containing protein n=1 Tax=Sphingobacterium TaxID=28453 RepID=UPI0013DC3FEC